MARKGEKKKQKQFRFNDESLKKIDELSVEFFGTADKKASSTLEEVVRRTAKDMGIEQEELVIRCAEDLLKFYQETANKNGKVMSVLDTAEKVGLADLTIQRYRQKLIKEKKLKAVSTSAVYLNGGA